MFTRSQERGETLESFYATLTAQTEKVELGTLKDELVEDSFISKMKNSITRYTFVRDLRTAPDEVLNRAFKFEQSKQTTQAFQKSYANTASAGQLSGSQIKIKAGTRYGGRQ